MEKLKMRIGIVFNNNKSKLCNLKISVYLIIN